MDHELVIKTVLDHPSFKHKVKFRSANRLGQRNYERNRIVKVHFETEEAATDFMRLFRTATAQLTEGLDAKPYARRDLTRPELAFRSDLRALAKWINENTDDKVILINLDLFYRNQ